MSKLINTFVPTDKVARSAGFTISLGVEDGVIVGVDVLVDVGVLVKVGGKVLIDVDVGV